VECPQCGAQTPDGDWNCPACRINVFWASRHYDDLAGIRRRHGEPLAASTPQFLLLAHERAMREREARGGRVEHKVRRIARRAMGRDA
jgi:hypothetical protein